MKDYICTLVVGMPFVLVMLGIIISHIYEKRKGKDTFGYSFFYFILFPILITPASVPRNFAKCLTKRCELIKVKSTNK